MTAGEGDVSRAWLRGWVRGDGVLKRDPLFLDNPLVGQGEQTHTLGVAYVNVT